MRKTTILVLAIVLASAAGCTRGARQDWGRSFNSAGEAISEDAQVVKGKAKQAGQDVKRTVKNLVNSDDAPRDESRISPNARTLDCTDPGVRAAAAPGECYN